jgi:predicted GH43/DUF377 family glycosyl hydrolase
MKGPGELFQRYKKNPILTAEDWPYQAHSVFNPAAAIVNGRTLLLDIIGHIVKENDSDLPIKMIYNSLSDPAAIEYQKGDLVSCGVNTYSPIESLLEGGETYKI